MAQATGEKAATLNAAICWWARARTSPFWMLVIAFALRLAFLIVAHTYKFKPDQDHFSFGYEMGRIGRAIAVGRGFADPFGGQTGPTAWEPPLYPYLIAVIFKLTGVYSLPSAFILLTINSIFSSLTCIPIFLIARKCFSEKVAVWSAWAWALLPTVMYWCIRWVWETSLAALLLTLIFWLALRLEEIDNKTAWIGFGLLWGVAGLTNTSLLSFLPGVGLWVWRGRWKRGKDSLAGAGIAALFFAATITPWLIRNYDTFGKFVFIRSNFGAELRLGNGPGADGTWMSYLHPTQSPLAMHRYEQLGETAYVAERKHEAINFIRADYGRFAWLSVKRFVYYWAGRPRASGTSGVLDNSPFLASSVLALCGLWWTVRKQRYGAGLFLWLVLLYPAAYYFVYPHARYRHPIEPMLAILIAYLISEVQPRHETNAS